MIVSIVDHGGARRRTKATAASVELLPQHEHDRHAGEQRGDPADAEGRRALAEPSDDRAHDRVDGRGGGEQEPDLRGRRRRSSRSCSGTSRLTPPPTRPMSTMIAMPASTSSSRRDEREHVAQRLRRHVAAPSREATANSAIVTAAAAIASTRNGVPVS